MSTPIIVMGAHGGIGECLTRILVSQDYKIYATARQKETLIPLAQELSVQTQSVDVLDTQRIETMIAEADQGEGIKGLAYCIGSIDNPPYTITSLRRNEVLIEIEKP